VDQLVTETDPETLAQSLARKLAIDPDLARLVAAWPTLADAVRAGIVAMVSASVK
jgi:hypothetical protein